MTQQEFLSRRQTLLAQMQPGSAALIFAAPEAVRSADSEYPYGRTAISGTSPALTNRKRCWC
ncbi:hypothetical protein CJ430_26980 [Klebsiella pneumoniae]|nr:hypothetical protein CJ430_26980 [Klebsiella pneumoniae]